MPDTLVSSKAGVKSQLICAHCGLPAVESIAENGNFFCCHGCKTAYSFLAEMSACNISEAAESQAKNDYSWLDKIEILNKWKVGQNGNSVRVRLQIPGIHCASCVQVLERLYGRKNGIMDSQVHFLTKELEVSFQPDVLKFSELVGYLSALGYSPSLADPAVERKKGQQLSESRLWTLRMAVAGFCAGNIMLLSFPEYLGLDDSAYRHFFGWINLVLALPAVFFSGLVYLRSVYRSITQKVLNLDVPIGVGMIATLLLSIYEVVSQTGSGYFDSLTGLIFFLIIGRWVQSRTFGFLAFERDFRSYFPLSIIRIKDAKEEQILSSDIQSGDLLKIRNGEIIPCDGTLLSGNAIVDYSFVSGESALVAVSVGSKLQAGGRQTGGILSMRADREMSRSELVSLWNNPIFAKEGKPGLHAFSDSVARYFTPAILILAFLVAGYWLVVNPSKSIFAFLSVLIIACPCTLALAYPVALGNTMRLWGRRGFFLKNADVVERLAQASALVFDKTGTLTHHFGLKVSYFGTELQSIEKEAIAALCSSSQHPLSQAIFSAIGQIKAAEVSDFVEEKGSGIMGLCLGRQLKIGSANWLEKEESHKGGSGIYVEIDGDFKGFFQVETSVYPFVEELIKKLSNRFNLFLLSGDTASGQQFWQSLFGKIKGTTKFAQNPQKKLEYVQKLQSIGAHVVMIGDGLNDAGALRQADAGIVVAATAHQFTPGSDAILLARELPTLPKFFTHARQTLHVVKFCFAISLVYNAVGLFFAVQGDLQPVIAAVLMPVSSLTVVAVAWLGSSVFGLKIR